MKNKRKIKKQVPAYAFGTDQITDVISGGAELYGSINTPSGATSQAQADQQGITDTLKGAASGAKIGTAILPGIGTAIGAVGGALIGGVGKSGQTIETPGFTEDNQYTYTTGLKRLFGGSSRDRRRISRDRANVQANRNAVAGSVNLANDYYSNNNMDAYMFAYGGEIPSNLAYVDDGELIDTPMGITQIPENNNQTDSNLVNLPVGSRVLSDKLKVPGTKKTFAQIGNEMMSKRRSTGTDRVSETTNMLNDRNDQIVYDQLYGLQEMVKEQKGIKPKQKSIPTYVTGGRITEPWRTVGNDQNGGYINSAIRGLFPSGNSTVGYLPGQNPTDRYGLDGGYGEPIVSPIQLQNRDLGTGTSAGIGASSVGSRSNLSNITTIPTADQYAPSTDPIQPQTTSTGLTTPTTNSRSTTAGTTNTVTQRTPMTDVTDNITFTNPYTGSSIDSAPTPTFSDEAIAALSNPASSNRNNLDNTGVNFDWTQVASQLGSLAPIFDNLFTGNAEQIAPEYNLYNDAIINTMRRRRINVNPILQDLDRSRAVANYNIDQLNTNTGANLAARVATATALGNQRADVLANAQNINNQYAAEYAATLDNLGQQRVSANRIAQDYNARSRAAQRNIRRTGLSQLSEWGQMQARDRNLRSRDQAYLDAYAPLLEGAYTQETYQQLLNNLRR